MFLVSTSRRWMPRRPMEKHLLLPGHAHGDPANRFLIATARTRAAVALATRDEKIIEYGKLGFVRVIEL